MKFYTRYNLPARVLRSLSQSDNVDRVSFVDSTSLVKRFIVEGRNLAMSRAHALYRDYNDAASSNDNAMPVYDEDIAITQKRLEAATADFNERMSVRSKAKEEVNAAVTKDNEVNNSSKDSGPAVVSET